MSASERPRILREPSDRTPAPVSLTVTVTTSPQEDLVEPKRRFERSFFPDQSELFPLNIARGLLKIVFRILLILPWTGIAVADNTNCRLLFAFDRVQDVAPWQTVNDDVMGGRSSGGASYADGKLLFTGNLNTNGGGFSSIRTSLPPGILEGMGRFKLKVLQDTRHYQLIVQTDASFGGRPVAYRADIKNRAPGNLSEDSVLFSELQPTVFGRQLPGPAFDASRARLLGIIIADAQDGAFHLEIETIHACPL